MIIQNGIQVIKTGKIYLSNHVHDYQEIEVGFGQSVIIDGGCEYIKRGGNEDCQYYINNISLDDELHSEEEIQQKLCWGTRGKNGKQPLEYKFIKDLTLDHLNAIIEYSKTNIINPLHLDAIKYWQEIKVEMLS